jgi:uncharacterized membrane protein
MVDRLLFALTLFSALGCGLIGGVFFAFPSFVMNALARLPAAQGIAAMQSINVVVINLWPTFVEAAAPRHLTNSSLDPSLSSHNSSTLR